MCTIKANGASYQTRRTGRAPPTYQQSNRFYRCFSYLSRSVNAVLFSKHACAPSHFHNRSLSTTPLISQPKIVAIFHSNFAPPATASQRVLALTPASCGPANTRAILKLTPTPTKICENAPRSRVCVLSVTFFSQILSEVRCSQSS